MYMPGLDFIAGFLGCMLSGMLAVPVYPVDLRNFEVSVERFQRIIESASIQLVLSHAEYLTMKRLHAIKNMFGGVGWPEGLQFEATDGLDPMDESGSDYWPRPKDLAFLQYTSGSTGDLKGVMVRHGNIVHNVQAIQAVLGDSSLRVGVSWVPQYHVGWLSTLYSDCVIAALSQRE